MFGLVVQQAREEKKWTQQELADKMGIHVDEIIELENGNADPPMTEAAGYFPVRNMRLYGQKKIWRDCIS